MATRLLLFATPLAVLMLVWQVPANRIPVVRAEVRLAGVDAALVDEAGDYRPLTESVREVPSQARLARYETHDSSGDYAARTVAGRIASLESERRARVSQPPTGTTPVAPRTQSVGKATSDRDTTVETLRELSRDYWATPAQRSAIENRLIAIADEVYRNSKTHFVPARVVGAGETLQSIAAEYDLTWEYLADLNQVEPRRLRAGQALKVVPGPFAVIVERSRYRLTVHANGYVVRFFDVGLGTPGESGITSTPTGRFTIANRLTNPTWYGSDGVVDGDDPANPLGEHWLGLADADGRKTSLGIHSTLAPHTIGHDASHGCIRMRAADIAELFRLLPVGAAVEIRD